MNKKTAVKQHSLKIALACAFALGATALSGSASAVNATATATATVVAPMTITNAANLVFGSFASGTGAGTVVIDTNGARSFTGAGGPVAAGTSTPSAARFNVTGTGTMIYTISYTGTSANLTSGSDTMAMTPVSNTTGAAGASALATTGTLVAGAGSIYVGATLAVAANQPAGAYSGTISATVDYQ